VPQRETCQGVPGTRIGGQPDGHERGFFRASSASALSQSYDSTGWRCGCRNRRECRCTPDSRRAAVIPASSRAGLTCRASGSLPAGSLPARLYAPKVEGTRFCPVPANLLSKQAESGGPPPECAYLADEPLRAAMFATSRWRCNEPRAMRTPASKGPSGSTAGAHNSHIGGHRNPLAPAVRSVLCRRPARAMCRTFPASG
jgi:hypothetical protein